VLRHQKLCLYFRESFAKFLALKIESFRNFGTIFKILAKIVISNFDKNENIGEHSICNFGTNFLGGRQGNSSERRRNIAKSLGKILGKFLGHFDQNRLLLWSSGLVHYCKVLGGTNQL